jgi:hypothetical protein
MIISLFEAPTIFGLARTRANQLLRLVGCSAAMLAAPL